MNHNKTYHLHLTGIVQGVGFRPMVVQFAQQHKLAGYVCNTADGLHIEFNTTEDNVQNIVNSIISQAPPLAYIAAYSCTVTETKQYAGFTIRPGSQTAFSNLPITIDFALCDACRQEMNDVHNRRYRYPFITCTQCGPRYSITQALPYERVNTSMQPFTMCEQCNQEYESIANRRYYSQTNSCEHCGVHLRLFDNQGNEVLKGNSTCITHTIDFLKAGKIVAVKGIGGYLLLCDASNAACITTLRNRKHRPAKPFAVLCKDVYQAKEIAFINTIKAEALQSVAAPIVLLKANKKANSICFDGIAPQLQKIGIMLPSAPLLQLIADGFDQPLIATSANISHASIIYEDEAALTQLTNIADYILTHNRTILIPQDDSVMCFSDYYAQPVILRRSRGLAPNYFNQSLQSSNNILCTGAAMKSSFCLVYQNNIYLSQYLGSTESYEAQQSYVHTVEHFLNLTGAKPAIIITDKHPHYFTTQYGNMLAEKYDSTLVSIQHHKAHFAAVLAENDLWQCQESVLGIIWDGTGLGDDGNIWGGEFLIYHDGAMERHTHFEYFPSLLGDKMAREPRLSALAACRNHKSAKHLLKQKFTVEEWKIYTKMLQTHNSLETSSAGRIFDAVASLLGLCDKQSYEGEAALYLETLAAQYFHTHGFNMDEVYFEQMNMHLPVSTTQLFSALSSDILRGKDKHFIAAKFHYSLVALVANIAHQTQCNHIAFSGGVFQNILLIDLLIHHLQADFKLYFHKKIPPNDENISLGQFAYRQQVIKETSRFKTEKSSKNKVEFSE